RTYSDIGRPYVVWNVVAAPEFSIVPLRWCFPIAGCVDYRGYFSDRKARRFAARLRARGDDVVIGGVPAYSTLGHFADPIVSSMLGYGDIERYEAATARDLEYIALFRDYRERLEKLYGSGVPRAEMLARKRATFASLAEQMRALERRTHAPSPYREWVDEGLNNAHLVSVATYYDCVPGFRKILRDDGGDLERFYADVRALAHEPARERDAAVCTRLSARPPRES